MRCLVVVPDLPGGRQRRAVPGPCPRDASRRRHAGGRRQQPRRHRRAGREGRRRRSARSRCCTARARTGSAPPTGPGSAGASTEGYDVIVQMDCDFSHDPAVLPAARRGRRPTAPTARSARRYVPGGSTPELAAAPARSCRGTATATPPRCSSSASATPRRASGPTGPTRCAASTSTPPGPTATRSRPSWPTGWCRPGCGIVEIPITFVDRALRHVEDVGPDHQRVDGPGDLLGRRGLVLAAGRRATRRR